MAEHSRRGSVNWLLLGAVLTVLLCIVVTLIALHMADNLLNHVRVSVSGV